VLIFQQRWPKKLLDGPHTVKIVLHFTYLSEGVTGGSTRFWTPDEKHYLDVELKVDRVLVFQQRMLVDSGEEVMEWIKVYDEKRSSCLSKFEIL
jgi:hypothetical protein